MVLLARFAYFIVGIGFALMVCPASAGAKPAIDAPSTSQSKSSSRPIVFYVAKGETDVCGPGCNTWIAGEGTIDKGSAARFRRVLQQAKGNPPLFLSSPGGSVDDAIAIGRMLRERRMTIGVRRSVPKECGAEVSDQACDKIRNSGRVIEAGLTQERIMCNSSCVYVLLGATRRVLDPHVKLGIHGVKVNFTNARGNVFDANSRPELRQRAKRSLEDVNDRLERYARDMIGSVELVKASQAIPHEQVKVLERADIFKFGIDDRDAGDSGWRFVADRSRPQVVNTVFHRHAVNGKPQGQTFSLTGIFLSCAAEGRLLVSTTTVTASAQFGNDEMTLTFGPDRIVLAPKTASGSSSNERRSVMMPAAAATNLWLANEVTLNIPGMPVKLDGRLKSALGALREMCLPRGTTAVQFDTAGLLTPRHLA